jgi:hypothetical protein
MRTETWRFIVPCLSDSKLEIVGIETEKPGDLVAVTATIMNTRIIPTHSQHDVKQDRASHYISLTGSTVVVE